MEKPTSRTGNQGRRTHKLKKGCVTEKPRRKNVELLSNMRRSKGQLDNPTKKKEWVSQQT